MILTDEALEFSKEHILKHGVSNFLFSGFEFKIIFDNWEQVKNKITNEKVYNVETFSVKKPNGGYRIIHSLDPINLIQYIAMVYMISNSVESSRMDEKIVFSNRIKLTKEGSFFRNSNSYNNYLEQSKKLAKQKKYILKTDIADFYNQIYLHRVQNNIEFCTGNSNIAKDIELFLSKLNIKASKGIPVGPLASSVIAEAIFIDIDEFIFNRGIEHIRYVDDIIMSSDNKCDLEMIMSELTQYLYDNHRLSINCNKTKIMKSEEYINTIEDVNFLEKEKIHFKLQEINLQIRQEKLEELDEIYRNSPYDDIIISLPELEMLEITDLSEEDQLKVNVDILKEILINELENEVPNKGILKHVLKKATVLRIRSFYENVIDNIDKFMPMLKETILYLVSVTKEIEDEIIISKFEKMLIESSYINVDYFKYAFGYYFANKSCFWGNLRITSFIKKSGIVNYALFSMNSNKLSWIREYKTRIDLIGRTERRAIIYASKILPKDERIPWLKSINTIDMLESLIIENVKKQ